MSEKLGRSLRIALAGKGFKAAKMARDMGVSAQKMSQAKAGQVKGVAFYERAAEVLGMKFSEFVVLGEDDCCNNHN